MRLCRKVCSDEVETRRSKTHVKVELRIRCCGKTPIIKQCIFNVGDSTSFGVEEIHYINYHTLLYGERADYNQMRASESRTQLA